MCSGDSQTSFAVCNLTENLGSLEYIVSVAHHIVKLFQVVRNGRCVDYQCVFDVLRYEVHVIHIVYIYAFFLQSISKF